MACHCSRRMRAASPARPARLVLRTPLPVLPDVVPYTPSQKAAASMDALTRLKQVSVSLT